MSETAKCEICGEPMPAGETMFKFHGYSGPCPKALDMREARRGDWRAVEHGFDDSKTPND